MATGGSCCEISNINIFILLKFLQTRHNSLLDDILTPRRWRSSLPGLLQLCECPLGREAPQCVDEDRVGFGNIETDVGDIVSCKALQNGQNRIFDDIQGHDRCKGLFLLVAICPPGSDIHLPRWQSTSSSCRDSWDVAPWPQPWG